MISSGKNIVQSVSGSVVDGYVFPSQLPCKVDIPISHAGEEKWSRPQLVTE